MSKARTLANLISDNAELADGQISVAEVVGAAPLASPTFTGTASGTFSGPLTGNVTGNITGNVTGAVTGDVTAPEIDLSAISSTISDTAVDVFVYDTRKDSDGGAWRKRTQHTSWYNETLNTSTRGSRKEFPSVAVIVAEEKAVTIYDGDDPDLPMWMDFPNSGAGKNLIDAGNSRSWTSVSMLNGLLCVGMGQGNTTGMGLDTADFITDSGYRYRNGTGGTNYRGQFEGNIAQRRTGIYIGLEPRGLIINETVNDVAMTVLPNAPIDAATGLPVPTIAVATDGGVSVIKDDETVVDFVVSGWTTVVGDLEWDEDNLIINAANGNTLTNIWYIEDAASRQDIGDLGSATGIIRFGRGQSFASYNTPAISAYSGVIYTRDIEKTEGSKFAIATNNNTDYDVLNLLDVTNNAVCYIASDYNTGWMNGDIKLATLSDTDDTDVTGSELVNFSSASDWTLSDASEGSVSFSSGVLTVTNGDSTNPPVYVYQAITTVVGKTYTVTAEAASGSTVGNFALIASTTTSNVSSDTYFNTGTGDWTTAGKTLTNNFTATGTTSYILLRVNANTAGTCKVAVCSTRIAEEDRSVNGNGLQVFGTVTKSAVATGADLVGYSGFSASNYLKQPHNDDLSFGVDDFTVMGWAYPQQTSGTAGYLFDRGDSSGHSRVAIYITHTNMQVTFYTTNSSGTAVFYQEPNGWTDSRWIHLCMVRRGTRVFSYIDGKLVGSFTQSNSLNNDNAPLVIGTRYNSGNPFIGKLSLIRWSATAPSPEQIAKIYEDEKVLFQENAQATLYGSSDAVTALAYDDSTELLHVGTSAGRSVFQGLRRVDNTTDAVGAAISASNGLVAED